MKEWLTITEAVKVMNVSERALRYRISRGTIESKKEDGKRVVLVEVPKTMHETAPEALQEKTERIADLQQQVENLQDHVDKLTQLLAVGQKSIQQLTEQNQFLLEDTRQKKLSFWKRILGRGGLGDFYRLNGNG